MVEAALQDPEDALSKFADAVIQVALYGETGSS